MRHFVRNILLMLIFAGTLAVSCTGRRSKAEHKDIIPENDLITILTEAYLADGLLSLPEINYKFSVGDTLTPYIDIIESHGYTKIQMDRTMRFYFVKKPKTLIKIYDKVLGKLSRMESIVDKDLPAVGQKEMNIWQGKPGYLIPDASGNQTAWIDFPVIFTGNFILKFTITIYPDDQSVNPKPGLYFSHTDSLGNEQRLYFSSMVYLKDGRPHTYSYRLTQGLPFPIRLKGWFIDTEGLAPSRILNMRVENIILTRNMVE